MKNYVELVLKKEKKAISFERLVAKIEKLKTEEVGCDVFLSDDEKREILEVLKFGVREFEYYETPTGNYILFSKTSFRKGRFYGDRAGAGRVNVVTSYVDRDGKLVVNEEKVGITKDRVNGAIDGDYVLIDMGGVKNGPSVVRVLDRNLDFIAGEVYTIGNSYFVKPVDKRKQGLTIAIAGDVVEGDRVLVRLDEHNGDSFYNGSVIKKFNHKDDPNELILWEAFKHGVDNDFSNESLEQLEHIPTELSDKDKIGREDLTGWCIFTIDGEDTKDMDDAISCTINEKGNYVLGVHITDVASLVPENSPLDKEAFKKGNSYYLGGTVLPMFPHKISNGIGSLNPYVERLTISCIMEISPDGEVVNYRISPTVIKSGIKMSYDKVNDILKNGVVASGYEDYADTLRMMSKLSLILRKKRLRGGSVEFDKSELKACYGEDGSVVDLSLRHQDVAENLIEEFMLIANETVDKDLTKKGLPCIHRVHDYPSEDKIQAFLNFLSAINLPFTECDAETLATDRNAYQKLVAHISKSERLSDLLTTEAIRCMSRAKYSHIGTGHYGLGKDYYCHFTSPIRRYSDLTDHRIIWDCLFDRSSVSRNAEKWQKRVPEISEQCSKCEKVADDTERDVLRALCAQYMENHIGEEFEGTITYISSDTITIQLDNLMEGTVRVHDLVGSYTHSPESYSLVSLDGFDNYYVGDRLRLKLERASKETKVIDFSVVEKIDENHINNSNDINARAKIKAKKDRTRRLLGE